MQEQCKDTEACLPAHGAYKTVKHNNIVAILISALASTPFIIYLFIFRHTSWDPTSLPPQKWQLQKGVYLSPKKRYGASYVDSRAVGTAMGNIRLISCGHACDVVAHGCAPGVLECPNK
jgi:hypothetical protein